MPSIRRLTKLGAAYYGSLIVAIVAGVVVGGGTGATITAIAAALFGLTIFVAFGGPGIAARDSMDRRILHGERIEDDAERRRDLEE
ncbi:MAG: hypothetical protein JST59_05080 [Actinobacteria bacterium]|nr:hypothetical protein [Actinomycetota bacterium]